MRRGLRRGSFLVALPLGAVAICSGALLLRGAGGTRVSARPAEIGDGTEAPAGPDAPTPPAPGQTGADRTGAGILPGDLFLYDIEWDAEERIVRTDGSHPPRESRVAWRGRLEACVEERVRGRWIVGFRFEPEAAGSAAEPPPPARVEVDPDGRTDLQEQGLPAQDHSLWLDLLAIWRVVPVAGGAERTEREADRVGDYTARYRRTSETEILRLKEGYLEGGRSPAGVAGTTRYVVGPFVRSSEGDERRWVADGTDEVRTETRLRFRMVLTRHERLGDAELEARRVRPTLHAEPMPGTPPPLPTEEEDLRSLRDLLAHLPSLLSDPERAATLGAEVTARIRDSIRGAASVDLLLARLPDPGCGDAECGLLLRALAGHGSRRAERGILSLIESAWGDRPRRRMAILALADLPDPGPGCDRLLLGIHAAGGDLAAPALLSLGRIAPRIGGNEPERFDRIVATIEGALSPGSDPEIRKVALQSLGESAPERLLAHIDAALADEDESIRAAAVASLARVEDPAARDRIAAAAREDSSESVRLAAIAATSGRFDDRSRALLQAIAVGDGSEEVRRRARELLDGFPPAAGSGER